MAELPKAGARAPDFALPDGSGRSLRLKDFQGRKLVLAFYPADWSPVCTNELTLFQEVIDEIRGAGAEILGISVDGPWSHRAWAKDQHLTFPLLADFWPHGEVSGRYGLFRESDGTSERGLIFVDERGNVYDTWVAENIDIAPGVDLVLDTLEQMGGSVESRHA